MSSWWRRAAEAPRAGEPGPDGASHLCGQITSSWLRWSPTLSAFGNIRLTNATGFAGRIDYYAVGAQLDWLIFEWLCRDAARHQAEAQRRGSLLQLEQLRDSISDEVINARRSVLTRKQGLVAAQRSVSMAKETLDWCACSTTQAPPPSWTC